MGESLITIALAIGLMAGKRTHGFSRDSGHGTGTAGPLADEHRRAVRLIPGTYRT
jgi:hypothetical protein